MEMTGRGTLAALRRVAEELALAYPWAKEEAVAFRPHWRQTERVANTRGSGHSNPGRQVADHPDSRSPRPGRSRSRQLQGGPGTRAVSPLPSGKRTKRVSEKNCSLAIHRAIHAETNWADRRVAWNRERPEWDYGDNDRAFRRDSDRAWRAVVGEAGTSDRWTHDPNLDPSPDHRPPG